MLLLYIITGAGLVVSLIASPKKTLQAIKIALKRMSSILIPFCVMLILVSLLLYFIPDEVIARSLGNSGKGLGFLLGAAFGSVTLMPGFIAYPLCGILQEKGVSYMTISSFVTTLMMVGIATFPIEKKYFGTKTTILRNVMCFFIAIVISLIIGLIFGELL